MKINLILKLDNEEHAKILRYVLESIKKQSTPIDEIFLMNKNDYNIEDSVWYAKYLQLKINVCKKYEGKDELIFFSSSNCLLPVNYITNYLDCLKEKDVIYTGTTVQAVEDYLIFYYPNFHEIEKLYGNNYLRQVSETNTDNYAIYGTPKDKILSRADLFNIRIYPCN